MKPREENENRDMELNEKKKKEFGAIPGHIMSLFRGNQDQNPRTVSCWLHATDSALAPVSHLTLITSGNPLWSPCPVADNHSARVQWPHSLTKSAPKHPSTRAHLSPSLSPPSRLKTKARGPWVGLTLARQRHSPLGTKPPPRRSSRTH